MGPHVRPAVEPRGKANHAIPIREVHSGWEAVHRSCSLGLALWRTELAHLMWCHSKELKGKAVHHLSLRFHRSPSSHLWDEEGSARDPGEGRCECQTLFCTGPAATLRPPSRMSARHVRLLAPRILDIHKQELEVWALSRVQFHLVKTQVRNRGGEKHSNWKKPSLSPGPPFCQTVQMGGCAAWRNACRWFTQRVGLLRRQVCGKFGFPPLQSKSDNLQVGAKAQVDGAPKLSVVGNLTCGPGAGQPFLPGKLNSRASFQMLPNVSWLAPNRPLADATRGLCPPENEHRMWHWSLLPQVSDLDHDHATTPSLNRRKRHFHMIMMVRPQTPHQLKGESPQGNDALVAARRKRQSYARKILHCKH